MLYAGITLEFEVREAFCLPEKSSKLVNQQETTRFFMKKTRLLQTKVGSSETIRKTPSLVPQLKIKGVSQLHSEKENTSLSQSPVLFTTKKDKNENISIYTSLCAEKHQRVFTHPFDWSHIHGPQHIKRYSPDFLSWFVGFSEGDGSFIVSGNRLFFTITQKDPACLYRLRTELGFGIVCHDTQHPEIKRFTVTDRKWIKVLVHLFNGNLLLKKTTRRFTHWVHEWNRITGDHIVVKSRWDSLEDSSTLSQIREGFPRVKIDDDQILALRRDSQVWQTSWLAGFLEAEGCFAAGFEKKHNPALRFILDQTGELEILTHVQLLLGDYGSVWVRKNTVKTLQSVSLCPHKESFRLESHYRFETKHLGGLQAIIEYITRHPLHTKKRIVFVQWKKLFNLLYVIRQEKLKNKDVSAPKRAEKLDRLVHAIRAWVHTSKLRKKEKEPMSEELPMIIEPDTLNDN